MTIAEAHIRRRPAIRMAVAGASGIAVLALFATAWPGADEPTVASGQVRLVDQTTGLPPNVGAALPSWVMPLLQQVDDAGGPPSSDSSVDTDDSTAGTDDSIASTDDDEVQQQLPQQQQDQDEALLSENLANQSMLQSQQQAELQNDQAQQQFTQDELQAQQTQQEADP